VKTTRGRESEGGRGVGPAISKKISDSGKSIFHGEDREIPGGRRSVTIQPGWKGHWGERCVIRREWEKLKEDLKRNERGKVEGGYRSVKGRTRVSTA